MKKVILLIILISLSHMGFSQTYPDIDPSIQFTKSDFTEIDRLIEEGQPNKAIAKILIVQIMAMSTENLVDLQACYNRLDEAIAQSGKEQSDVQALIFEQHKLFHKATNVSRNIAARHLYTWCDNWYFRQSFSFDEESLKWPSDSGIIQLKNGDITPLRDYYKGQILANEGKLMRISSQNMFDDYKKEYYPTVFDVLAHQRIQEDAYYMGENSCYFLSTNEFAKQDLTEEYRLLATLELLNKRFKRWDAYAFCVQNRMELCDASGKENELEQFYETVQKDLILVPASNRFALLRAYYFAQQAAESDWRAPSERDKGFVKSLEIINQALALHPKSDFTEQLQDLKKKIEAGSLSFVLSNSGYPAKHNLLSVTYRNLSTAYLAVYEITKNKGNTNDNPAKRYELKAISERQLNFDADELKRSHTKDFILSDLNRTGQLLIVVAPSKAFLENAFSQEKWTDETQVFWQAFQNTNLVVRSFDEKNGYAIIVTDAENGQPISNATIKIEPYNKYEKGGMSMVGQTDENGYYKIEGFKDFHYTVIYKNDSLQSFGYFRNGSSNNAHRHLMYTDRSIYRPGQAVYFKSLSFDEKSGDGSVWKAQNVDIRFTDENGKDHYRKVHLSNDFGTCTGSFVLPKSGFPLGTLNIYVNDNYVKGIQVEEYKRPTFEVTFDEPKGRVVLGEKFTMTGKVMAYAGYPLSDVEVTIDVSESRYFPYWCFVMDEWRNHDTTIKVKTDKDGVFTFEYTSPKPKDAYAVYYNFDAKAVDISGETQTANHFMYLGKNAYWISADVLPKYKTNEEAKIKVDVYNSQNEKEENVNVKFTLNKLDQSKWYLNNLNESEFKDFDRKEFEKKFKQTSYYADQTKAYAEVNKGEVQAGKEISLTNLLPGNYSILLNTVDEIGDTVSQSYEFIVWNPDAKKDQHQDEFWAETTKQEPAINEPVDIYLGSSHKKAYLLTAVHNENGLISLKYSKLRKRKKLNFTVNEENKTGLVVYNSITRKGKTTSQMTSLIPVDTSRVLTMKLKSILEPLRPGSPQSWEIEISQNGGQVKDAELLASMYDASLDAFVGNYWPTNLISKVNFHANWNLQYYSRNLDQGSFWGSNGFYDYSPREVLGYANGNVLYNVSAKSTVADYSYSPVSEADDASYESSFEETGADGSGGEGKKEDAPKAIRENFNETAFFEPQIRVSADGTYKWNFTLPDALTRWKLMTFAHTTDFKTASNIRTFEARKELMLETFEPRFWKKGDELFWVGKVVNLSDKEQTVDVSLKIQNLMDESDVSAQFGNFQTQTFTLKPNESRAIEWPIQVTDDVPSLVRFEAEASTKEFSDIVRKTMPVLDGKERITLAQNFTFSKEGTHQLGINDIKNVSDQAKVLSYSVSVQTKPLWSTMLSLTQILQPTNELNESYFGQYFGASLAQLILNEHPDMKQALKAWQVGSEDAVTSLLEQNEELKAILLSETPWALEGKSDTERLRRLSQLLDDDYLQKTANDAWLKLQEMQLENGSWSWIGKDKPCWYMTQYFLKGLVQLQELGVDVDPTVMENALLSLDREYIRRYDLLTAKEKENKLGLGTMEIEWLYIRSVLKADPSEITKYYAGILEKNWTKFGLNTQAIVGAYSIAVGNNNLADKLMGSFEDRAQKSPKLGMYWNKNLYGYGWYENDLQTQAMLIHFYTRYGNQREPVKAAEVMEMQKWLLQQKRTQMWDSPKSTAMACHALMDFGKGNTKMMASVQFAGEAPQTVSESNPFDKRTPTAQNLETAKSGAQLVTNADGLVFASTQIVYTDKASNISKTTGDFRIERHYYVLENGEEIEITAERAMEVGDLIRVKLKLISDRELEFVYLEDPKAAGWEAKEVLSGYRYDNAVYYLSNRDSKTEIFIENLRKGTYIFEYDLKVTVPGKLQVGPAKVSCYYAPSFSANSNGELFEIIKK